MRGWVALLVLLLFAPMLVFSRFGPGWAAAELAALVACWLPVRLVKPATSRRGPTWAFPFFVYVMTTLLFPLVAPLVGLWLSPWWCLGIALGGAMLIIGAIWPAQTRYYQHQRQSPDATVTGADEAAVERP